MIMELRVLSSVVIASPLIALPTMAKDTGLPRHRSPNKQSQSSKGPWGDFGRPSKN